MNVFKIILYTISILPEKIILMNVFKFLRPPKLKYGQLAHPGVIQRRFPSSNLFPTSIELEKNCYTLILDSIFFIVQDCIEDVVVFDNYEEVFHLPRS
jgi:hypothetical protein